MLAPGLCYPIHISLMNISYTLLLIAIAALTSCQKADEQLEEQSLKVNRLKSVKNNAEIKDCRILQISYPLGNTNDVMQFTYNSFGDPVSVTRLLGTHTGHPNFVFKYDEKNRLIEFIGHYNNSVFAEFWHKYFYDKDGNIVLDSGYIFPRVVNGFPENAHIQQLTYYTYDNQQRIIKDSTVFSTSATASVHTYTYDARGNKTGVSYDDQVNLNRTNKIWMFINRDYSINNPFKADSYNLLGLPTSLNLPSHERLFGFLGTSLSKAQINYECKAKKAR